MLTFGKGMSKIIDVITEIMRMVNEMKLLKITVDGLALFREKLEIDFAATQRVNEENAENMYHIFGNIYQNNVLSIVGINASGKTSLLKVLSFVMRMLNNEPINSIACNEILDGIAEGQKVVFETYFYTDVEQVHCLRTVVEKKEDKYCISEEELKSKHISRVKSKKGLYDFTDIDASIVRDGKEAFLLDDVSIMVAFNKQYSNSLYVADMLQYTNTNLLSVLETFPAELIAFFDPSIEYLKIKEMKKDADIRLKFRDKEEIVLNHPTELNRYLSSGTIKGINIFIYAMRTFEKGGYLIVDELENHFNKEIVSTMIRFYRDFRVNPKGAVLVFSTHYAELLDEFERNDNIFIARNRNGITIQNLSKILKRNDIKKSEAYQSGFLEGTVPMYESYMDLKKVLLA